MNRVFVALFLISTITWSGSGCASAEDGDGATADYNGSGPSGPYNAAGRSAAGGSPDYYGQEQEAPWYPDMAYSEGGTGGSSADYLNAAAAGASGTSIEPAPRIRPTKCRRP